MLTPKELMIGNIVTINNPEHYSKLINIPMVVTGISPAINGSISTYSIYLEHLVKLPNTYYESYSQYINFIQPIELTPPWIKTLSFKEIKRKGQYGAIYALSVNDYDYCVERDFNKHTSYFFGVENTDSPFEYDFERIEHFSYDLKYVHQLQNLFQSLQHIELPVINL
jgi:hypothetical protein